MVVVEDVLQKVVSGRIKLSLRSDEFIFDS